MRKRGIAPRYAGASLRDFSSKFGRGCDGRGLFVSGPRGVGKTHLLAGHFRSESEKIEPIRIELDGGQGVIFEDPGLDAYPLFVSAPELLLRIRATFGGRGEETEGEIINEVSRVPVLFLDDLGAEAPSAWSTQALYLVIDRRYGENLKTFISSNYDIGELAKRLDDRITSRIAELCEVVKMTGPDRRIHRAGGK
jgi:DNA replication protein DnaC